METQSIEELVDLKGRVAVVTGGASGIGQAIAMTFGAAGAAVMIADGALDAAEQTAEEIKARGGYAEAVLIDACSAEDARHLVRITEERLGGVDILVNAAATFTFSPVLPRIDELWGKVLGVHVRGVFYYCDAMARSMVDAGCQGRIVNIASMDAMQPARQPVDNDVTSSSVAIVSKALAIKYGPNGICVNALAPGAVHTPAAQMQVASLSRSSTRSLEQLSRYGESPTVYTVAGADEIVTATLFLVSAAAEGITGNLVVVG